MPSNPFGDDARPTPRPNPFGEDEGLDPMKRLEGAPARLRVLRSRVGAMVGAGDGEIALAASTSADCEPRSRGIRRGPL